MKGKSKSGHDGLTLAPPDRDGVTLSAPNGTELSVELDGVFGQLKSELVGQRAGRYLIVRTPLAPPGVATKLFKGNRLTAHYLDEGVACSFQSTILASINDPEPLLFLAAPVLLEEKSLRHGRRIDVHIPCLAAVRDRSTEATIVDLGIEGCLCILPTHLESGILHLHMGDTIVVEARLPDGNLRLAGTVRSVSMLQTSARVGIHFEKPGQAAQQRLIHYLVTQGVDD